MNETNNIKIALTLAAFLVLVTASFVAFYTTTPPIAEDLAVGGGSGTINQLDQWKSDGTNITQAVANKPIKITGLSSGNCLTLNGSSVLATTTCGGSSISFDGFDITDPNFLSTGDIAFSTSSSNITANINAGSVSTTSLSGTGYASNYVYTASTTVAGGAVWKASAGSGTVTSVDMTVPTGLSISGNPVTTSGTLALSLTSGYVIPLTASTTDWASFFDTPSTRITAGDALTWSANTINFDGGAAPAGSLGGTWASPTIDDLFVLNTSDTMSGSLGIGTTLSVTGTSTLATSSIPALSNLTSNGFVKTSGSNGLLSIDTNTYLTGNQSITLSGDVTGSGATAITTTIASGAVDPAMLANADFGDFTVSSGVASVDSTLLAKNLAWTGTGTTTFAGNMNIAGNLIVQGATNLEAVVTASGDLNMGGNDITNVGTITATNASLTNATTSRLTATGVSTLASTTATRLSVGSTTIAGGTQVLTVDGSALFTGETTLGQNLYVTGNIGLTTNNSYLYWGDESTLIGGNSSTDILSFYTAGSENLTIDSNGDVGIGTTTPDIKLTVIGGIWANGTSTLATTTLKNLLGMTSIDSTSITTIENAFDTVSAALETAIEAALDTLTNLTNVAVSTILQIPFGTNPTVTSDGALAFDSTNMGQLKGDFGTSTQALVPDFDKSLPISSSTTDYLGVKLNTGTTTWEVWNPTRPITINSIYCQTDTGTALVRVGDGTNWTEAVACSSSPTADTSLSNNTFTARERFVIQIGTSASSPNRVTPTFNFIYTLE